MDREEQRTKLLWLMFFRVVVVTFLLGGTALIQLKEQQSYVSAPLLSLYFLIGFTYFLTFVYSILISQLRRLEPLSYLQLCGDVLFITVLVYATGGVESIFSSAYILAIIAGSVLLFRKGAIILAASSAGVYSFLISGTYLGWITALPNGLFPTGVFGARDLYSSLLYNVSAFFMVGALSSYLSEQLRATGELLRQKLIDYDELDARNRSIVHSLPHGIITVDLGGAITSVNRVAADLIGKRLKEVYSLPLFDILPGLAEFSSPEGDELVFSKNSFGIKVDARGGQSAYFSFYVSPLTNASGKRIGWILNFEDVTSIKELEDRFRVEEEMQAFRRSRPADVEDEFRFHDLIGKSEKIREVFSLIRLVSPTNSNILIQGESGTGKELVARAIHSMSPRKDFPFLAVNLGAVPETLMESELFGHKKGSFTGAISDKVGLFEMARGGTLFLDEIGELSMSAQVRLLRVIQEKAFRPVGGTRDLPLDVRFICATNKDLWQEVKKGNFREDLYYRLNVIQVLVPPLRERGDDIAILAQFFLDKYAKTLKKPVKKISAEALKLLRGYHYPGNVRELENLIERGLTLEASDMLMPESLPPTLVSSTFRPEKEFQVELPEGGLDLEKMVENIERQLLLKALERTRGVKRKAADLLNISFRSFRYRLSKYGLSEEGEGAEED